MILILTKNDSIDLEVDYNISEENREKLFMFFNEINKEKIEDFKEILNIKINFLEKGDSYLKTLKTDIDKQNISGDEKKLLKSKIDENIKNSSTFSLCQVLGNNYFDYLIYTNKIFKEMVIFEKERAYKFLTNKEEAEKAGWYIKNPKPIDLITWAEKAYPNFNVNLWESKIDLKMLETYIKLMNQK